MSEDRYEVVLLIAPSRLSTILEVVKGDAEVQSMRLFKPEVPTKKKKEMRYVGGRRDKGISALDALDKFLEPGPQSMNSLRILFKSRGFAEGTASSTVSRAMAAGTAVRLEDGRVTKETRK